MKQPFIACQQEDELIEYQSIESAATDACKSSNIENMCVCKNNELSRSTIKIVIATKMFFFLLCLIRQFVSCCVSLFSFRENAERSGCEA
jgi:hypothetical protein